MNDSTITLTEEQTKALDAMVEATAAYAAAAVAALQAGAEVERVCSDVPPDVSVAYTGPPVKSHVEKALEGQTLGVVLGLYLAIGGLANGGEARTQVDKALVA